MRQTLKERLHKQLSDQRKWVEQCGGNLAGYIANYHGKHGRTIENTTAIYDADMAELRKLENRVSELLH